MEIKVSDKVKIHGSIGRVVATSGKDRTCIVEREGQGCTTWINVDLVELIQPEEKKEEKKEE